jgi:hypothetical protein
VFGHQSPPRTADSRVTKAPASVKVASTSWTSTRSSTSLHATGRRAEVQDQAARPWRAMRVRVAFDSIRTPTFVSPALRDGVASEHLRHC